MAATLVLADIDLRNKGEMIGGESSKRGSPAPRVLHFDFKAHEKVIEADERPSGRKRARDFQAALTENVPKRFTDDPVNLR